VFGAACDGGNRGYSRSSAKGVISSRDLTEPRRATGDNARLSEGGAMRHVIVAAAVVATISGTPTAAHAASRGDTCRYGHGDGYTTAEVTATIECAVARWPVAGGVRQALSVARCESGADMLDRSTDGYAGTYQQATSYWPSRLAAYNRAVGPLLEATNPNVHNPRSNVLVSIRSAHFDGWGAWACA
jgi:hypothetical protein